MEYELQFRLMLNTDLSRKDIIMILKETYNELVHDQENSCTFMGNRLELVNNEDYDSTMINDPEDGYLYFRYLIGVYPINDNVILDDQVNLSKSLCECFNKRNIKTEIVADFEELL